MPPEPFEGPQWRTADSCEGELTAHRAAEIELPEAPARDAADQNTGERERPWIDPLVGGAGERVADVERVFETTTFGRISYLFFNFLSN
jgi:hypothetical protein